MTEKRCSYAYNRVLIDSARVLSAQFDDAVIHVTGAQLELLRNVTQYLNRLTTYVSETHAGYYLTPDASDFDDILEIVAELEEVLMGNPNTLFGYSDRIFEDLSETKSGDGSYQSAQIAVPEGKLWMLQDAYIQMPWHTRGYCYCQLHVDSDIYYLWQEANPARDRQFWTGNLPMKEGDFIYIAQALCLDGDFINAGFVAYEMDVPA